MKKIWIFFFFCLIVFATALLNEHRYYHSPNIYLNIIVGEIRWNTTSFGGRYWKETRAGNCRERRGEESLRQG
jgi:hypothetical protein